MLKKLNSSLGETTKHKRKLSIRPVWSYVPLVDKNGQSTGFCRVSCRVWFLPFAFSKAEVCEYIAEKLCQELNSQNTTEKEKTNAIHSNR